ncbi:MAG TPA: hypothetical protein GX696_00055 [Pseudomonadaceae bacterium]|nr:hypothetical protein [Pseudomonadaceae bacterium]
MKTVNVFSTGQRSLVTGILVFALALLAGSLQAQIRTEYDIIDYPSPALDNPVARLQEKLASGEVTLEYTEPFGYLESLLEALGISPDSQTLVFSKTSLQYPQIDASRPRALYTSDDAYIGWVRDSRVIELTAMDSRLGAMFYVFNNNPEVSRPIERQDGRCLVCHDSNGLMGGGIPLLLVRSSLYNQRYENLLDLSGAGNVTDSMPVSERWGGWYVTGQHGSQTHLGNILLDDAAQLNDLDSVRQGNLDTLEGKGFFDTSRYLRPTSDIVALMVLEHQLTVQNQLTYVRFKAPAVLERIGEAEAIDAPSWESLSETAQRSLARMLDNLVDALLLRDAATLEDGISGNAAYHQWFEAQGPADAEGNSLREFDLQTRLFRYPLSYLIHSADFKDLPPLALDYVMTRLAEILQDESAKPGPHFPALGPAEKQTILGILEDTEPELWAGWF